MTRSSLPPSASVAHAAQGARLSAPSAERNAAAITAMLADYAPQTGAALELASGTGQHVAQFAAAFPGLTWQPTEIDADRRASIDAWAGGTPTILPAIALDATQPGWGQTNPGNALIVLVNLLHLIDTHGARTLVDEAAKALAPGGRLVLYGPFLRQGQATSDGDSRFDASLRAADPAIGYKDAGDIQQWLADAGLGLVAVVDMPANNLTFVAEAPTG